MTPADNEHEERARTRKAYRLSRVIADAVRDSRDLEHPITVADMRTASHSVKLRVAGVARVNTTTVPSALTWEMACDLAEEHLR